ncbi:ATP-binding protein [Desulfobacterales bacterium HSG2]|nr:ATP-binding protein [Desulfobacterales bacterium HSG2]
MITEIYIDNFKSLVDFRLPCHSLTCIIGINNSGKTSILQAIDFLSAIARSKVGQWLKSRDWKTGEIKSQFKKSRRTTFKLCFTLQDKNYSWSGTLNIRSLSCSSEQIARTNTEQTMLLKVESGSYHIGDSEKSVDFEYEGSILGVLKEQVLGDELTQTRHFLRSIKTLELLNPLLLRKRARTAEGDLGIGGEKLSAFLYDLPEEKKRHIHRQMRHLFDEFEDYHIKAKHSGWKELRIFEKFENLRENAPSSDTEAKHISDGFLRILAIFSQLQTDHSVLLFDEIEDGLNHEVMEYLMDEMVGARQQIFLTTHSPMILNFLEDDIAQKSVMLVHRDSQTGKTQAHKFFDIPQIREKLEYMGPGEVFANVSLKELP